MKKFLIVMFIAGMSYAITNGARSQNYLWPTNASQYLTSSFAEYRPGHFHAGIDIKTWGTIGYEVYAIRDGYIMRLSTSPFGYGKVVYQKLDTGETAVYAHLDRFNEQLEKFVKQEQKRFGEYRLNKYLSSFRFPVKQGDVIGYTGSTGTGSPHLHFELRDGNNNPLNPFLKGFHIKDTTPPVVEAISITPLNANSRVNADVLYWITKPQKIASNWYRVAGKPFVSGKIGFAIECFDKANEVDNSLAVYQLIFYVDDELKFSVSYNNFSYGQTHLIDFDRDYRLQKKGFGIFQNLYKAKFNELPIYKPAGAQIGVLNCDPDAKSSVSSEQFIGAGGHRYKIELRDFWGNLTTVSGEFIVDKSKDLATEFAEKSNGNFLANNLSNENDSFISRPKFSISRDSGISWLEQSYSTLHSDSLSAIDSMPGYELQNVSPVDIFKTDTITQNGQSEIPLFHPINNSSSHNNATNKLFVEKDFFNDFIRIKISAKFKLLASPKVSVQQAGSAPTELSIFQKRINEFVGVYPIQSGKDGLFSLSVWANEKTDKPIFYHEQFDLQTVTPFEGGSITSPDGDCQLAFTGNNVYENLFLRLKEYKSYQNGRYDMVGAIYEIFPQDVLLKGKGTLTLHYPQSDTMPEKLGIYGENKNNWRFIGNKLDKHNQAVRTEISSLNTYTLIRDILPPVISIMQPMKNARLSNNKPKILVQVYDSLSGLASERSILIKLDGQKVIAEYDPEAKLVKFECEDPLLPGEHQITVIAVDNCKNQSQAVQSFFVIQ